MRSQNRKYYPRLDMLRGIAAWWVVAHHCFTMMPNGFLSEATWPGALNPVPILATSAWMALTIFFVLSGYSIGLGLRGQDVRWLGYLQARWLRVAPLYLVMLAIGIAVAAPTMAEIFGAEVNWWTSFLEALTLMPFREAMTSFPWMATVWSVRIEAGIYLLVPVIVFVLARFRPRTAVPLVVGGCLAVIGLAQVATNLSVRDVLYAGIPGRLLEFSVGMSVAFFVDGQVSRRWGRVAGAAGVFMVLPLAYVTNRAGGEMAMLGDLRVALFALGLTVALLLLLWATPQSVRRPGRLGAAWVKLGTWSYSTYLWHFAVLVLATRLSIQVADAFGWSMWPRLLLGIAIVVAVTLPLSWASYRWIESPFLRMRPRYVRQDAPARVVPTRA